jgi:hypothetical protein
MTYRFTCFISCVYFHGHEQYLSYKFAVFIINEVAIRAVKVAVKFSFRVTYYPFLIYCQE